MHVLQARGPRTGPRIDAATLGLVFPVGREVLVLGPREPPGKSSEDVPSRSGMPVVRHQDVAVEQEAQPSSCSFQFQCLDQQRVFRSRQKVDLTMEVDSHEEDAVRKRRRMCDALQA
jgi:hypothetical protein